mmetsp:Transcript_50235/g.112839  ORF Transcript_50235/g.112839 Transcript_50235/m.112839 type:complete len:341 (+) Transcript_50235:747-1769(+)
MRVVILRSRTHFFMYSSHSAVLYHVYCTSSNPSSSSTRANFWMLVFKAKVDRSLTLPGFLNHSFSSSGVNSATAAGSTSSSSSGSGGFISTSSSSSSDSSWGGSSAFFSSLPSPPASFSFAAFSASSFFFFSLSIRLLIFAVFFLAISLCFERNSIIFFRNRSCFLSLNSLSAFSCLSLRNSSRTLLLKPTDGSPIMTLATFLKRGMEKFLSLAVRSSLVRLPATSMTMKLRGCADAMEWSMAFTLPSSMWGTPKLMSGLSPEVLCMLTFVRNRPLLRAHSRIFLSLSSVYKGFLSTNQSSQSKVPSSGRQTGKSTSYLPSFGVSYLVCTTSAFAASCTM